MNDPEVDNDTLKTNGEEHIAGFREGLKCGVPIGLGYFAVSFTFGMAAVKAGLSVFEATMISLLNLTSAGQFAGLDVMIGGGTLVEMAVTQFIINLRYSLMSFTVSQKLDKRFPFWHRFIVAFGVTDEIFGVTAAQPGKVSPYFNYGAMILSIPGWTLGTLCGAFSGSVLPGFITSALGVAIYGMFLAIIIPPAKHNKVVAGTVAAAMALSSLFKYAPVLNKVSDGFVIIIVTVIVASAAAYFFPHTGKEAVSDVS